jgi:hypothetical protein
MASCAYCSTTILFGGVRDGNDRFCNARCHQSHQLMSVAEQLPPDVVQQQIAMLHQGACPKCGGRGPIDIHTVYKVWSALVLTSWFNTPQLSCRACATRSQTGGALFSLGLGWWGFPWGLVMTPVQITRNIVAMSRGPDPARPSAKLEKHVKVSLAAKLLQRANQNQPPPPRR